MKSTDLELVTEYAEKCRDFIDPKIFRQVLDRGLYSVINRLPKDAKEAKAVVYARMVQNGKAFGDSEIDEIAGYISLLKDLRNQLNATSITDADVIEKILTDMQKVNSFILNYFK